MTQENAKEYLPHVQALADGELQVTDDGNGWCDIQSTHFHLPASHYRRRPTERKVIHGWAVVQNDAIFAMYQSRESALEVAKQNESAYVIPIPSIQHPEA